MIEKTTLPDNIRIETGVRNLDSILDGGIPKNSLTVLAGTPGAGKTILSQQIIFQNASPERRALVIQTLSEPSAKTLKYLRQFEYSDLKKLKDGSIEFVDLGKILRSSGLEPAIAMMVEHIKRVKPTFVIIDSFKVFEDLARSREELRKFTYEIAIHLMVWECTSFLLGEFSEKDIETNPLFSIVDGIILLKTREEADEVQRFIRVIKMRGTNHSRDEHSVAITSKGMGVYAPRVTIRRDTQGDLYSKGNGPTRGNLGISKIDQLLGNGVPYGSSFLVSGVAGTGKTLLSLEFIYRGAKEFGEKGIFFSFEETEERLLALGKGLGWDLQGEIKRGKIELVCIPQTDIRVEEHLLMLQERIEGLKAKRIAVDSASIFLHKVSDPRVIRERVYQLATLVQRAQAIGFLNTDIPYGSNSVSRFGVEETIVDGVILLTASEKGFERERFIEIYKLRNTAHLPGRHPMEIVRGGLKITPRIPTTKKQEKKRAVRR
jgi:circadian clock protein KaiC